MTSQTPHRSSEDLQHQDYIWAGIIATVISAQCHILMMAQEASHSEKAHWTEKEVDELVLYLFTNRGKVGDTGNFKDVVYNAAAEHIAEHWQQGARKTGAMCKTKWGSLKKTFNDIQKYRNLSGVHWDNTNGAGIEGEAALSVWNEYISKKGNSTMRPFRSTGWKHYEYMDAIVPGGSGARGRTSYRPKKAPPPSTNANAEPPDEPATSAGPSSIPAIQSSTGHSLEGHHGTEAQAAGATAATGRTYAHINTPASELSISLNTSSANTKRSHTDMMDSLPPASTMASTSVSAKRAVLQPGGASIPVKKARTTSGPSRAATSRSDAAKDAKVSKATTASAMLGFQSSVNRLTDVIAERMSSTADRLMEQRSRAMQMLQFEDSEMPFEERLLIQEVFARDPISTDIYTQTTDPDLRRAFILSAARRLPPSY